MTNDEYWDNDMLLQKSFSHLRAKKKIPSAMIQLGVKFLNNEYYTVV